MGGGRLERPAAPVGQRGPGSDGMTVTLRRCRAVRVGLVRVGIMLPVSMRAPGGGRPAARDSGPGRGGLRAVLVDLRGHAGGSGYRARREHKG